MDRVVAIAAGRDRFPHLSPRKPFLEPLVAMAGAGDQMMFGGPIPHHSPTQLTRLRIGHDGQYSHLAGKTIRPEHWAGPGDLRATDAIGFDGNQVSPVNTPSLQKSGLPKDSTGCPIAWATDIRNRL